MLVMLVMNLVTLFCLGINDPGKSPGSYQDYAVSLNPDCYYNWSIYSERNLDNPKFTPMLWKVNDGNIAQAVRLAKAYPGRTWLIYNEPENNSQANVTPELAATWFDKAYSQIKVADPTAVIACCGNIVSSQGIDWLNSFILNIHQYPDVWHIHIYTNSTKFSDWKAFIDYWWYWNGLHGGNKPTYVTETCAMYQDNQETLLESIYKYSHPLLHRVYWFGAYDEPQAQGWKCSLLNSSGDLLSLGDAFKGLRTLPNKLTPQPEPPTKTPTPTVTPTNTPQPTITVIPLPSKTPTPISTTSPVDETTSIPEDDEPTIFFIQFLDLIFN